MRVIHAGPVVREVTAGMREHNLQPRIAVDYAVEYEVADGDGRFERIADDVVEIMIHQAVALCVAERVHKDDDVELLRARQKLLETETRVREIFAVHIGQN